MNTRIMILVSLAGLFGTTSVGAAPCSCEMLLTPSQKEFLFGGTSAGPSPKSTQTGISTWPGGVVHYQFDPSVSAIKRELFNDAALEISSVAGITFVPRTNQTVYALIKNVPGLEGGNASLGRPSNRNAEVNIGSNAWTRFVLAHELGHLIGLIHEHQRSDRDRFIEILTDNIVEQSESRYSVTFKLITNSVQTGKPYDFDSRMHYFDTAESSNPLTRKTLVPKPGYEKFAGRMGTNYLNFWTPGDRYAMTTLLGYGAPAVPLGAIVSNTQDSGSGSLRAALYFAQDNPGTKVIFRIPTSDPGYKNGVFTIRLSDAIYGSGSGTEVDGTTQTAFTGNTNAAGPEIAIRPKDGLPSGLAFNGMILRGQRAKVSGISFGGFRWNGLLIDGPEAAENEVRNCHIGCGPDGNTFEANGYAGVRISDGADGSRISDSVLSCNTGEGIHISDPGTIVSIVDNCVIGLDAKGLQVKANGRWGVRIDGEAEGSAVRNSVVSGNLYGGILISGGGTSNSEVRENLVGLDKSGTRALENSSSGITLQDGVEGSEIGPGNVVSGNRTYGIALSGSATQGNRIFGNIVGLDKSGIAPIPNGYGGMGIWGAAHDNVIGGSSAGDRNTISGNMRSGVSVLGIGSNGNRFLGNWIGLDRNGDPAGNEESGINLENGPSYNKVGGILPNEGNVIAANGAHGVLLRTGGTIGNEIQGNFIGVDRKGRLIGNGGIGIYGLGGSSATAVGGADIGEGNLIRGNSSYGILFSGTSNLRNLISGNSISDNRYDGIELSDGANRAITRPVLTAANLARELEVTGSLQLNGQDATQVVVEFFASDERPTTGFEQGKIFLGSIEAITNSSGTASFSATLRARRVKDKFVTATARLAVGGETSSFSNAIAVSTIDPDGDGIPTAWESLYGLNGNSARDAESDLDGDGFTNLQEFHFGTNPRDDQSRVSLHIDPNKDGGINLRIGGANQSPMIIYYSDSLESGSWELLGPPFVAADTETFIQVRSRSRVGMRFYRIAP